jgi:peptidoglycan/LPS O-acetylase OafA/YrhL
VTATSAMPHRKPYGIRRFNKPRFRDDLEGLRAVAILLVVTHHVAALAHYTGLLVFGGVDMSFVLSGFFVTSKLLERASQGQPVAFGAFFARRARRILPLAGVVIAVTVFASYLWLPVSRMRDIGWDAFFAAISGVNFWFGFGGIDYLDKNAVASPLQHYWSLAVEEQFYFVWAFLFAGIAWIGRKLHMLRPTLVVFLLGVVGVSLWLSVTITQTDQSLAYFGTHTRAFELGIGCLIGVGAEFFSRIRSSLATLMTWAGLAVIGVGSYMISRSDAIPGSVMLWPVLGTALVIAGGCQPLRFGASRVLSLSLVRFVGRLSYGWYLWHWPALVVLPFVLGRKEVTLFENAAAAMAAFGLAVVTYYLVEKPIKANKELVEKPRRGIAFGTWFAGLGVAAAGILLASTVAYAQPARPTTYADPARITQQVAEAAQVTHLSPLVVGELPTAKDDLYPGCITDIKGTKVVPCMIGDANGGGQMVLLGSSLAWQWIPPVNLIAQNMHMQLAVYTKGACPAERYTVDITEGSEGSTPKSRVYTECDTWRTEAYAQIAQLRPQLVVMSSRVAAQATPEVITATVKFFQDLGATVVVIGETPSFEFEVPDCLGQFHADVQKCVVDRDYIFGDVRQSNMAARAAREAGAIYIDPLLWLCTDTHCPTVIGGKIVYHDAHHLTATYSSWVAALLEAQIKLT